MLSRGNNTIWIVMDIFVVSVTNVLTMFMLQVDS